MSGRSVAIVTGGSIGIGAAICRCMMAAGREVVENSSITGQVLYVCGGTRVASVTF
jgi:NAD(P)-dependent dehydrogenase (short-subunit alcohol dehydrogenase family)